MARNSIELLKDVDAAIVSEKRQLRRINIRLIVYNGIMTLLLAGYSIYQLGSIRWIDSERLATNIAEIIFETILLINAVILVYSVILIRKAIKSLHNAFPNEIFIRVHLINSFIYVILYAILSIMTIV